MSNIGHFVTIHIGCPILSQMPIGLAAGASCREALGLDKIRYMYTMYLYPVHFILIHTRYSCAARIYIQSFADKLKIRAESTLSFEEVRIFFWCLSCCGCGREK